MPLHESVIERNQAQARQADAEAKLAVSERKLADAEARKENAYAEQQELVLASKQRDEKRELAKDEHFHVYVFDKDVNDTSVKACVQQLTAWSRQDPQCGIELQINSPGGSIFDGLALVDFLRSLQSQGHAIDTVAFGKAASMGGVLLQVGNQRIMGKNAILLIHEGSLGAIGDFGQVEDRVELMKLFHELILDIFAERSQEVNKKSTKEFIRKNWKRKDWWLSAEKALELGFVDEVR